MGYYVQTPKNTGKALQLRSLYNAEIIDKPESFEAIPEGKALIVIVDNTLFEAAAYAYSASEFEAFTNPFDERFKQYVLMDKKLVEELVGYDGSRNRFL